MQETHQHNQKVRKIEPRYPFSPGKPEMAAADHFPLPIPNSKKSKSAVWGLLISVTLVLAAWLAIFLITGLKSFYMATLMGVCGGIVYGLKVKTKTRGVFPAILVFILSGLCTLGIALYLLSVKLGMNVQELKSFFGPQALTEAILEQYTFWDVFYIVLAVSASVYFSIRMHRKRRSKFEYPIKRSHTF